MKSHKQRVFVNFVIVSVVVFVGFLFLNRANIFENIFDTAGHSQAAPVIKNKVNQSIQKQLAALEYSGVQVQTVNNNVPYFSKSDVAFDDKTAWQKLSHRDLLGRPQVANALLNASLMPRTDRKRLSVKTPGYHVYKFNDGGVETFLYNRSHLIGYQLTGLNNDPKNLVTGTVAFNASTSPGEFSMETYENQVASYLRRDKKHYVRYRVTPIYRSIERVPRGVEMEAQSIGDDAISFNVYVFNAQPGWQINYYTGTALQQN